MILQKETSRKIANNLLCLPCKMGLRVLNASAVRYEGIQYTKTMKLSAFFLCAAFCRISSAKAYGVPHAVCVMFVLQFARCATSRFLPPFYQSSPQNCSARENKKQVAIHFQILIHHHHTCPSTNSIFLAIDPAMTTHFDLVDEMHAWLRRQRRRHHRAHRESYYRNADRRQRAAKRAYKNQHYGHSSPLVNARLVHAYY